MDWLKDKKNQPIIAVVAAVVIVLALVFVYKMTLGASAAPTPPNEMANGVPGAPGVPGGSPAGPPGPAGSPRAARVLPVAPVVPVLPVLRGPGNPVNPAEQLLPPAPALHRLRRTRPALPARARPLRVAPRAAAGLPALSPVARGWWRRLCRWKSAGRTRSCPSATSLPGLDPSPHHPWRTFRWGHCSPLG